MITIEFNGKKMSIGASEERALRILKRNNFAAKKSELVEGSTPRYQSTIVPKSGARRAALGIHIRYCPSENLADIVKASLVARSRVTRSGLQPINDKVPLDRWVAFFKENPRCQSGIFGNPRRINAILKKIDTAD